MPALGMKPCNAYALRCRILINEAFRFMSVNWLQATTEQRKALYKVAKSIATTTPLTLEQFLNKALGITVSHEWGDLANIRNGKLAREKCQTLYDYLAEHH
jgi:hypothetical protein